MLQQPTKQLKVFQLILETLSHFPQDMFGVCCRHRCRRRRRRRPRRRRTTTKIF